jgi:hypothetical protein
LRHVRVHAELLVNDSCARKQFNGPFAVAGFSACQKHAGVVSLRVRQPGSAARPSVHIDRGLEVALGIWPARHGGRQKPQVA